MTETRPIKSVAIVLYEGFDEPGAIGPYEVLENAAEAGADLDVALCTLEPAGRVTASHGLAVEPDSALNDLVVGDPDLVVVPGGGWTDGAEHGARAEVERGALPDAIAARHRDGATVVSVCTGGMILAAAGVLDGRPATTHHGAIDDLRETAANVVGARVIDDSDVLTAGGVTARLDLALWLVERGFGVDVAEMVASEMEYERRGEVYRGN